MVMKLQDMGHDIPVRVLVESLPFNPAFSLWHPRYTNPLNKMLNFRLKRFSFTEALWEACKAKRTKVQLLCFDPLHFSQCPDVCPSLGIC